MKKKETTNDDIANALINMSESSGLCDKETAKGFKISKNKRILKSSKEGSFAKFMEEIKKRQENKN